MRKQTRPLAWAAAGVLRRFPGPYWAARRAYTKLNGLLPPRVIEGIPGPVHRNDLMINPNSKWWRDTYVAAAVEAVGLVDEALAANGTPLADADVLDFGCGHGRVVRQFSTRCRSITACDLNHEGVRFCARHLGAIPVYGATDIKGVHLGQYDAIWLGSVVTHHPADVCAELLQTLAGHLRPGGVMVATSNDHFTLDHFLDDPSMAWLGAHDNELRAQLDKVGAAYVTYPQNAGGYGLAFQTDDWLDEAVTDVGLRPLWHRGKAWIFQAAHAWTLEGTDAAD